MPNGSFLAWIESSKDQPSVVAAFVGVPPGSKEPIRRLPATKHCASEGPARQWVESEANAIGGVRIEWVSKP
jgi:hypothetical protein